MSQDKPILIPQLSTAEIIAAAGGLNVHEAMRAGVAINATDPNAIVIALDDAKDPLEDLMQSKLRYQRLQARLEKLQQGVEQEAQYCYHWEQESRAKGDESRAGRHRERGDRLMALVKMSCE